MTFWDENPDVGAPQGSFVSSDEKAALAASGTPLVASTISLREGRFGDEYVVAVDVPDDETGEPEQRVLTFPIGSVQSRDAALKRMEEYLRQEDAEPVSFKIEKAGRAYVLRPV